MTLVEAGEDLGTRFDERFRCHATNRSGTRCRLRATPGATVCKMHGGAAPQVQAAAKRRLEKARRDGLVGAMLDELRAAGQLEGNPLDGLAAATHRAEAMVRLLETLVAELTPGLERTPSDPVTAATVERFAALYGPDHLGDDRPHVLVSMLGDWTDRHAKLARTCVELGLEERRLRLDELDRSRLALALRLAFASLQSGTDADAALGAALHEVEALDAKAIEVAGRRLASSAPRVAALAPSSETLAESPPAD